MRRIFLLLTVAAITAAMMVFSAVPAFAQEFEAKDDKLEIKADGLSFELKPDKFELKTPFFSCELKEDKSEC